METTVFKRKIYNEILEWKNNRSDKYALLIRGARRVGKSTIVEEFASKEFKSYIMLDFARTSKDINSLFEDLYSLDFFFLQLQQLTGVRLYEQESVIIFDEVQLLPKARQAIKYLVEDGRYKYIETGSLLSIRKNTKDILIPSEEHKIDMYPMDFEEFCWAIGVQKSTLENIRESCRSATPIDQYIHDAMMTNFRTYLVVGGMPEVVQRFLDTKGDLAAVRAVQNELNRQYRHDISQYAGNRALQVQEIFDQLPTQLIDGNGRFAVSSISPGARYDRNQKDFLWLVDAGVALKTNCVTEPKSPLKRTAQSPKFELYQSDTGMLMARYPQPTAQAAYLDDSSPNLGAIYENVIAQELTAQGIPLYYYMAKKHGEVDFIADTNADSVMPFEVKSGRSYRMHAAIDAVLANAEYRISQGVVLSRSNIAQDGGTTYLPLYATYCLRDVCNLASPSTVSTIGDFSLTVHPV